jgi:hypothetical protein
MSVGPSSQQPLLFLFVLYLKVSQSSHPPPPATRCRRARRRRRRCLWLAGAGPKATMSWPTVAACVVAALALACAVLPKLRSFLLFLCFALGIWLEGRVAAGAPRWLGALLRHRFPRCAAEIFDAPERFLALLTHTPGTGISPAARLLELRCEGSQH